MRVALCLCAAGLCCAQTVPKPSVSKQIASKQILVHGHRGARALRPENTLPAFEYGIAQGVDALELDMAVTKDNVIVVSHDPLLHPPVCSGPQPEAVIRMLTLPQVREWDCGKVQNPGFPRQQTVPGTRMPTLEEVFALAPRGNFSLTLKPRAFPIIPNSPRLQTSSRVWCWPSSANTI